MWRLFAPFRRSDDEITAYVATKVETGRITPEWAPLLERALREEAAGKCVIMRNPQIKPRPPKAPGMQSASRYNGFWWHR
jgi:hypothetical protein